MFVGAFSMDSLDWSMNAGQERPAVQARDRRAENRSPRVRVVRADAPVVAVVSSLARARWLAGSADAMEEKPVRTCTAQNLTVAEKASVR